ncbi:MAG: elongation factor G [Acidobacteria bacterium]|nr:elongation factor G [Acidobacteriota bacterium]
MKVYEAPGIRNLAVVGHGGCGKTSLVSAMLFDMGAVTRQGRVEDGTTVTDFDPDEIERRISLQTALAFGEWRKTKINVLDAPGYANFLSEAKAAVRVADAAIVVVDAVAGVEVQTEKTWGLASDLGLPRLIVVNRMDRERASFTRTLEVLEKAFGRGVVPLVIPLGEEKGFVGVTDLLTEKADVYSDDQSGKFQAVDVPERFREAERTLRDRLVEMVAETNEELMEEFFEKGTLPQEDLVRGLHQAVRAGKLFPVFAASSARNVGLHPILDAIVDLVPSPAERGDATGTDAAQKGEASRKPAADAPFSAFVFKTLADPHAGRISLFRVYSGVLKADGNVHNATRDTAERVGGLFLLQGKNQTSVPEIQAGDLGAVAKLKETQTGDTLCDKASPIVFPPVEFPEPSTTFAIEPKTRGDEDKISQALHRLMEEDPVLRISRDAQTHEMLLSGAGQLHVEVVVAKLRKRYKVEVNLKKPKIPYRETVKAAAEGHGRHKKQTGGHGQFGDCKIRMKPLPRGEDFKFVDDIFGGSIPRNFIPAVEKGIQEARHRGPVAGYPMVDFQVELFDGQYHDVDSSELSFKIAGSLAFKDAVARCKPTLLEPIMKVEIAVPEEFAGAVMGDLSSRRGRPQGMEPKGSLQIIKAEVPMAEMLSYDADLTSMTGARGSYHMELSHYDEVPFQLQEKVVAAARAERGEVKNEE